MNEQSLGGARVAMLLAIGIGACKANMPSQAHPSVQSPSRPVSVETKPLDLTVRIRAERDGRRWGVATGDTLKTGDFFELYVYLNQPAYLYVMQMLPDGTFVVLFPDQGDRLLAGGREHRIPNAADESFQLDPHDKEENIYVLMSRIPIQRTSALISVPDHRALTAGPGSAKPRRPDRILSITTRRVLRVKRPNGTSTITDTASQRADSTLVVWLYFKHT